jgi:hypothetical protein
MDEILLVRRLDTVDQLLNDREGIVEFEGALEIVTFDVLHDEIVRTDVIEVADVGMVQRRNRSCFTGEALGELSVGNLDRHIATEAVVMRSIDFSHATFADKGEDFIRAEFVAGRERHRSDSLSLADQKMVCA